MTNVMPHPRTRMYLSHIPLTAWPTIRAFVQDTPSAFLSFDMGDGWAVLSADDGDAGIFTAIQGQYPMIQMRQVASGGRATVADLMGPVSYGCS